MTNILITKLDNNKIRQPRYDTNYSKHYNLTQTLQFDTNNTACDKHVQIVTNREKDRKQKKNNGDIEALAYARRALEKTSWTFLDFIQSLLIFVA